MKELLKKITSLIESIDYIENSKYNSIKNQITEEVLNVFLEVSKDVFVTAINIKVLKPIQHKINMAINFSETKRSRSYRSERLKMLSKKDFLINLRNQLLIDYKEQFKELELYKEFLIEKANNRFLILNPTKDYPIEIFTRKQFENILKKSYLEIIAYFNNKQLANSNYKEEIFLFVSASKKKLNEISERLKKLKSLIGKRQNEDVDSLFDLYEEVTLLKLQENYLVKLIKELENSYFFLKIYTPKKETPLTVFGNRDVNKLEQLYFELEEFLDKSVQLDDIINIFTLAYEPTKKIDLRNGTTNDFAYLINELHPFFLKDIAHRNHYNQWWADRFTINGVEKDKKAIIKIRSNTKNDLMRRQEKTTRLNSIVNVLK